MTVPKITGAELAGNGSLPLLLVGPSLGTSAATLWAPVAQRLAADFHVVGWSLPGHDGAPVADPFDIAELAAGVLGYAHGVCAARGDARTAFGYAGDSVGGAVGLQLLLDVPDTVRGAVLACTGARIGDPQSWAERAATVRSSGTGAVLTASAQRWFAPGFLERHPETASALLRVLQEADPEGYAQVCAALADFDVRDRLAEITAPVIAVAGAEDRACPVPGLQEMAEKIAGAELVVLDDVAHLAPAESPAAVTAAIRRALTAPRADPDRQLVEHGIRVRREVLGDEHVDRAIAGTDELTRPFQELITRYAWGAVWGRDVLDRRSRSLVTLALLAALGHERELAMHVRAALRNGLRREEIAEVLLHTGVYAGVPVSNTALAVMQEVFADIDR